MHERTAPAAVNDLPTVAAATIRTQPRRRTRRLIGCGLIVALVAAADAAAREPNRPIGDGKPSPAMSDKNDDWKAGLERREARWKALESPEQRKRRTESKLKFQSLDASEALDLAERELRDVFEMPLFDGTDLGMGTRVVDHRGKGAAIVEDTRTGRRALVQSSLPLQTQDGDTTAPVDLSLEASGDALRTGNALAPLSIDRTSRAKVALTDAEFSLELADAQERSVQRSGDRSFFAELRTDTDAVIVPTATGAELGIILRSTLAAERQVVRLNLPAGATARRAESKDPIPNDPPQSVEVRRGDRTLGYIHPPNAFDADGRNVPTRMRLDGDELVIEVDHRERDVRYPIFVDPEINAYGDFNQDWPGWAWGQALNEPRNYSVPEGYGAARNDCAYYCGLYQSHPTGTYNANGSYAHWYFQAPLNTYIYRSVFGGIAHDGYDVYGRNHTDSFQGVSNSAYTAYEGMQFVNQSGDIGPNPFGPAEEDYWGVTHDFCVNPRTCSQPISLSERNYALFGIHTLNKFGCCGLGPAPQKGTTTMAHALVYLGDRRAPDLTSGLPGDRSWRDDNDAVSTVTPNAHDDGLGMYSFSLSGAASGDGLQRVRSYVDGRYDCSGSPHFLQCPANDRDGSSTFGYRPAEGVSRLSLTGQDAVGNSTGTHSWVDRVDRTRPEITALNGTLFNARNREDDHRFEGLYDGSYALHVEARDAHSGLRDIEVFVTRDGGTRQSQRTRGAYSTTGTLDWTMRPDDFADGDYTVEVIARDNLQGQAGASEQRHTVLRSFRVTVDRRGDVYGVDEYGGGAPAQGGELIAREYARYGATEARSEDDFSVTTRSTVECPGDAAKRCGEIRSRSLDPESGTFSNEDDYDVKTGRSVQDPELEQVADIAQHRPSGDPVAHSNLVDVLQPFQHAPPAHGTTATQFRTEEQETLEDGSRVTVTTRVWVDDKTSLPLALIRSTSSDPILDNVLYDYHRARREPGELPNDFFSVGRPSAPMSEQHDERTATARPNRTDEQTGLSFEPLWIGASGILAGQALCLSTNQRFVGKVDEPTEAAESPDDPELTGSRSGTITAVHSNYNAVTDLAACQAGVGELGSPVLTVTTYSRVSTVGSEWISTYVRAVTDALTNPSFAGADRAGTQPVQLKGLPALAYYVPLDDDRLAVMVADATSTYTIKGRMAPSDIANLVRILQVMP